LSPDGVLGTLEARLAVMHAIDRQALVDMVYGGMVATPSWPVSDAAYGYEPAFGNLEVYAHGYDVEKARA
jgi:ABC-type transport system substrate-binding protein